MQIITFKESFQAKDNNVGYDENVWMYLPKYYLPYRYILGTKGNNPLICIGINPSTAEPDKLDNTLKSVERISKSNGYDSFIMLNVSPERATNPNNMSRSLNQTLVASNIEAFEYALMQSKTKDIWLASGSLIRKRDYLPKILEQLFLISVKHKANWFVAGKVSQLGDPHHPLYLKKDEKLLNFDMDNYMRKILTF